MLVVTVLLELDKPFTSSDKVLTFCMDFAADSPYLLDAVANSVVSSSSNCIAVNTVVKATASAPTGFDAIATFKALRAFLNPIVATDAIASASDIAIPSALAKAI